MASFEKQQNGTWKYRISFYINGKRHTKNKSGFRTKQEAKIAASELERELNRGNSLTANEESFIGYFNRWFNTYRKGKYSWQNERDLHNCIRVASLFFNDTKLKDIDRALYQQFINSYAENHAKATVKKVHTYVRMCLKDALNDGVIYKDPTYKVLIIGQKDKEKKEKLKYLNQHEVTKLVISAKEELNPLYPSRYLILFGIASGCRFSESLGLTWDCVDFNNNMITINKTWDYQKLHDFDETKNEGSKRTIFIDKYTMNLLKSLQSFQRARQLKTGLRNTKNLVFINDRFEINSNNAVNKCLKKLCKKNSITEITYHALRHTHASILLYKNLNIKYVSRRLGHTDITTTLQRYGHILDEMEQRESQHVEELMCEIHQ